MIIVFKVLLVSILIIRRVKILVVKWLQGLVISNLGWRVLIAVLLVIPKSVQVWVQLRVNHLAEVSFASDLLGLGSIVCSFLVSVLWKFVEATGCWWNSENLVLREVLAIVDLVSVLIVDIVLLHLSSI